MSNAAPRALPSSERSMHRLAISGRLHSPRSDCRRDLTVLARRKPWATRVQNVPSKTERGNDLSHHDLGGRRLDRSLADALSLRCERFDCVALAAAPVATKGFEYQPISLIAAYHPRRRR